MQRRDFHILSMVHSETSDTDQNKGKCCFYNYPCQFKPGHTLLRKVNFPEMQFHTLKKNLKVEYDINYYAFTVIKSHIKNYYVPLLPFWEYYFLINTSHEIRHLEK